MKKFLNDVMRTLASVGGACIALSFFEDPDPLGLGITALVFSFLLAVGLGIKEAFE